MNVLRRSVTLFFILIVLLQSWGTAKAQGSSDVRYFPETGHTVKGEFLRFYEAAPNPLLVYGYPITEQFTSKDGMTVQYFQRARFELKADLISGQRVQLTALGQSLHKPGNQQLAMNNSAGCERFSTGFHVCFAFLEFFNQNGGAAQFGDPISPFEFQDNLIVQYFENARFEWRADRPEGQRVVLSDLGRIYFDQLGENQSQLKPIDPVDATIDNILSIHARAFVQKAIALPNGQQTVYILVQSQTQQAVSNANGKVTIRFPDGRAEEYFFTTNTAGLGSATFRYAGQKTGELVKIEVVVTYQGLAATTTTSFRIWH